MTCSLLNRSFERDRLEREFAGLFRVLEVFHQDGSMRIGAWRTQETMTPITSRDIVYAGGQGLSVYTLADLLKATGAVEGMEPDINPDWASLMTYSGSATDPAPVRLWGFVQPPDRCLQLSDRDFVSVSRR